MQPFSKARLEPWTVSTWNWNRPTIHGLIRYLRTALCTLGPRVLSPRVPRLVERAFPLSTPLLLFVVHRFTRPRKPRPRFRETCGGFSLFPSRNLIEIWDIHICERENVLEILPSMITNSDQWWRRGHLWEKNFLEGSVDDNGYFIRSNIVWIT